MSKDNGKKYKLTSEQFSLLLLEAFSIDKKNVKKENNLIISFIDKSCDANYKALEQAFNRLVDYNDSLRLHIYLTAKGLRQSFSEYSYEHLSRRNLSSYAEFEDAKKDYEEAPISFFDKQLYKATIYTFPNGNCSIIMSFHHAVVDGYSISLIMDCFEKYYTAFKNCSDFPADEKRYSIIPFLEDEYQYKKSKQFKSDFAYWWNVFNHRPGYSIPTGKRSLHGFNSFSNLDICGQRYDCLNKLRKEIGCSDQALVMGLIALTTFFCTGKRAFNIATLVHGRTKLAYKKTIGCMMNAIPIPFNIDLQQPVKEFFFDTYSNLLISLSHGKFPLSYQLVMPLKYSIACGFNFAHNWLFISKMDFTKYINDSKYSYDFVGRKFQSEQLYCAMYNDFDSNIKLSLSYQNEKFTDAQIHNATIVMHKILDAIIVNPDITISNLHNII